MAKFNIEVELDWIDEYEDGGLDDLLKDEVIHEIQSRLTKKIEEEAIDKISESVDEKVEQAVDSFLESITAEKIEKIKIPHKESRYSSEVKMVPISEYIGQRFEHMTTEKNFNGKGGKYDRFDDRSDGPYSMIEYLTKGYIAKELNEKVISMIQQAKSQAEETLISNLEENLQQQMNADMLERLDVKGLLEGLQNTILIEGDSDER